MPLAQVNPVRVGSQLISRPSWIKKGRLKDLYLS